MDGARKRGLSTAIPGASCHIGETRNASQEYNKVHGEFGEVTKLSKDNDRMHDKTIFDPCVGG